jgi:hypothetical protein
MEKHDRALFGCLERRFCYCGMPTVWVDDHGCRYAPRYKVEALGQFKRFGLVIAEFDPRPLWFVCRCGRSVTYDVVLQEAS